MFSFQELVKPVRVPRYCIPLFDCHPLVIVGLGTTLTLTRCNGSQPQVAYGGEADDVPEGHLSFTL